MKLRFKNIYFVFGLVTSQILFTNQLLLASLSEEDNLVSDIWQFFKIIFFVVIAIGAGLLIYLMYRREVKRNKEIEKIEDGLNNLKQTIKERTAFEQSRGFGSKNISSTMGRDFPSPQEESEISQKIESIERKVGVHTEELRNVLENLRRQQKVFSLIQEMLKKEISSRENTLQEISNFLKLDISYEEIGVRKGEPVRQTSQIKKAITETNLIDWWNEFGNQRLPGCKETLQDRFSDIIIEETSKRMDPGDWRIIGVLNKVQDIYYILPRKYSIWWSDFRNRLSDYETWFELVEKSDDATLVIKSLSLPLPKAIKTATGELKLTGQKGKVSIRETQ